VEHAYKAQGSEYTGPDFWYAKIPYGKWLCKLGQHKLHSGPPFMTYEVTGIPNHTGLLFHPGNTATQSEGCILLGCGRNGDYLTDSRKAFNEFIEAQSGCEEFWLEVR
jgi:hypothetical protein